MQPLLIIRSERDQMSAIERRIADFILDNAHLLRDYSSQQLANALGISQSSVVKFSQKLGFKGYPDLKYSIGEAIARGSDAPPSGDAHAEATAGSTAQTLWQAKARAEEETRLLNPAGHLERIAAVLGAADRVFVVGLGEDGIVARGFAIRLSLLGLLAIHHSDPALAAADAAAARPGDALVLFCERGDPALLGRLARTLGERGGTVVSVTRHAANALRARADLALQVSAHDDARHIEPLLYQAALQHLLDQLYLLLCEDDARRRRLDDYHEHMRSLLGH